ncbi:UNVERIFIED_CONTAM: hypothetical protein BEN50_12680 [Euhalothece sp. KZN 001]
MFISPDYLLPNWQNALTQLASSGRLLTAAQEALQLETIPDSLAELIKQWQTGDFSQLPTVELLSNESISGAMGAYASSLETIYLNEDWLATASEEDALAVLMEELGHHLDNVVNEKDAAGDEGAIFASLLQGKGFGDQVREEDDRATLEINGESVTVEQADNIKTTPQLVENEITADGIQAGETFEIEFLFEDLVTSSDDNPNGVVLSGYTDVLFNPTSVLLAENGISYGEGYTTNQTGDNRLGNNGEQVGRVSEVGAATSNVNAPASQVVFTLTFEAQTDFTLNPVTIEAEKPDEPKNLITIASSDEGQTRNTEYGQETIGPAVNIIESEGSTEVSEDGATDSYELVLNSQPTADVTIEISNNMGQVSVEPTSLTFTPENWDTPQEVTVTADDEDIEEGEHTTPINHSVADGSADEYLDVGINNVSANITDNDGPGNDAPIAEADLVVTEFDAITDHALNGETTVNFTIENQGNSNTSDFEFDILYYTADNLEQLSQEQPIVVESIVLDELAVGEAVTQTASLSLPLDLLIEEALKDDPPVTGQPVPEEGFFASNNIDYLGIRLGNDVQGIEGVNLDDIAFFPWDFLNPAAEGVIVGGPDDLISNGEVEQVDLNAVAQNIGRVITEEIRENPSNGLDLDRMDFDLDGVISPVDAVRVSNRVGYAINPNVPEEAVEISVSFQDLDGNPIEAVDDTGETEIPAAGGSVQPSVPEEAVEISVSFQDLDGNPIETVNVGEEFEIVLSVEDLREAENLFGVFSIYGDVNYDTNLASILDVEVSESLTTAAGEASINESQGVVDEIGGVNPFGIDDFGVTQTEFAVLTAEATAQGLFEVSTNVGDGVAAFNTVNGFDNDVNANTVYRSETIEVEGGNAPPFVEDTTFTIDPTDDESLSSFFGEIFASDPDGDFLEFTIVDGNEDIDGDGILPFVIESDGFDVGLIFVDDIDDLQLADEFFLTVEVSDGEFTNTAEIIIEIEETLPPFNLDVDSSGIANGSVDGLNILRVLFNLGPETMDSSQAAEGVGQQNIFDHIQEGIDNALDVDNSGATNGSVDGLNILRVLANLGPEQIDTSPAADGIGQQNIFDNIQTLDIPGDDILVEPIQPEDGIPHHIIEASLLDQDETVAIINLNYRTEDPEQANATFFNFSVAVDSSVLLIEDTNPELSGIQLPEGTFVDALEFGSLLLNGIPSAAEDTEDIDNDPTTDVLISFAYSALLSQDWPFGSPDAEGQNSVDLGTLQLPLVDGVDLANDTTTVNVVLRDPDSSFQANAGENLDQLVIGEEGTNQPPTIIPEFFTINADSPVGTVVGTIEADDPDGDDLTFAMIAEGNNDVDGDGQLPFTIDFFNDDLGGIGNIIVNDSGDLQDDLQLENSFNLTVEVSDGEITVTETVEIFLDSGGIAPTANDESFSFLGVPDQSPLIFDVLENDISNDGSFLEITDFPTTTDQGGTLELDDQSQIIYTPSPDFTQGIDSFTYTITNESGGTDEATVEVAFISEINEAEPNDSFETAISTGITPENQEPFIASGVIGNNENVMPELDVDVYAFDLASGDRATIDIDAESIGSNLDSVISVFDGFGNLLTFNDDELGSNTFDSQLTFTATFDSTYYAEVESWNGSSQGEYEINVDVAQIEGGRDEPNDTLNTAIFTDLSSENPGTFNFSSTIGDNPNLIREGFDVDLFELQLDAGDSLTANINTSELASELDSYLRIFDQNGIEVAFNDDREEGESDSLIEFTADRTGSYYVGVSGFGNGNYLSYLSNSGAAGSTGKYDVELVVTDNTNENSSEPNDTIANAVVVENTRELFTEEGVIGDNNTLTELGKDVDLYEVQLTQGFITSFDVDTSATSSLDLRLRVFNSSGKEIDVDDDSNAPDEDFNSDPFLEFTPPSSGTYYVGISDFANDLYSPYIPESGLDAGATGTYTFEIQTTGFTLEVDQTLREGESDPLFGSRPRNDTRETALEISLDEAETDEIGDNIDYTTVPGLDVDFYSLTLEANQVVTIEVNSSDLGFDSVLRLFNSDGAEIAFNDDFGGGTDSLIEIIVPKTEEYFIGVSGYGNEDYDPDTAGSGEPFASTGDYEILVSAENPEPNVAGPEEPNDLLEEATNTNLNPNNLSAFKQSNAIGNNPNLEEAGSDVDIFC